MPTKLRIDLAGFHHVINRGVNRSNVFLHNNDKDMFLYIFNKASKLFDISLHTYALMDNHYHLLLETTNENLSSFMRTVNANYALYFNKKYKRSGHLWQDRFKSKYIISDEYLYTLIRYIEQNPIAANLSSNVSEYIFTFSHTIINNKKILPCLQNSILIKEFSINELINFLNISITKEDKDFLNKKASEKIEVKNKEIIVFKKRSLKEHFLNSSTKKYRNINIKNAYLDGYTQAEISTYLNLSKSTISKIIKSGNSATGV